MVLERVQQLEDAYGELVKLAVERRLRLEESRKLWQFYWGRISDTISSRLTCSSHSTSKNTSMYRKYINECIHEVY